MQEPIEKNYFGCVCRAYFQDAPYKNVPWRFSVEHDGRIRNFTGIPNYCVSRRQALKRAWFRAMAI